MTFYATPVDANGTPTGPAVIIGKDEINNGDNYYYRWHVVWNLARDEPRRFVEWQGNYRLSARAMDEAGNIEADPILLTTGIISIDNVAPTAVMTIVPPTCDMEVERNKVYTFLCYDEPADRRRRGDLLLQASPRPERAGFLPCLQERLGPGS